MANRSIIVIGASAGGVEALSSLVRDLPAELPAACFVVLHLPTYSTSILPNILTRSGALRACHPSDGDPIQTSKIYVAPPDYHLMVEQGRIRLVHGPRENGHRPAVDVLFRSAARAYGPQVIGVVLSGALDDGTAGLAAIKRQGGLAIVQSPEDALFSSMPQNAIDHVQVDRVVPVAE